MIPGVPLPNTVRFMLQIQEIHRDTPRGRALSTACRQNLLNSWFWGTHFFSRGTR